MWVEHQQLPFISYPYEWSFESLKQAAQLTLDLLIDGLENGYILRDGTAFNVQFINSKPIFMDVLSFSDYREGEPFLGYKQFNEHFLSPLCLSAFSGVDFNHWFRGCLEGLDLREVSAALPLSTYFRPQVLLNIHLQAWAMRKLDSVSKNSNKKQRRIPRKNLIALAKSLKKFIAKLERKRTSYWQNYSSNNSYSDVSQEEKMGIAKEFVKSNNIRKLLDLGCNTGDYVKAAIEAGSERIIGTDFDGGAIDLATKQAGRCSWPAQFLCQDLSNPSPNQGWGHTERTNLENRLGELDGVFAFALVHHLVIGKNIPLTEFLHWICNLAPRGLIEFIPKTDAMVRGLLSHREDIFPDYNQENFHKILRGYCASVTSHAMKSTERVIYEYAR